MANIDKSILNDVREYSKKGYSQKQIGDVYLKEIGYNDSQISSIFDSVKFLDENSPSFFESSLAGLGRGLLNFGEGIGQGLLESGENLGLVVPGATKKFTQEAQSERDYFDETEVGQSAEGKVGEFVGEIGPALAIPVPGAKSRALSSIAKNVGELGLLGGALGGAQFTEEGESRLDNIKQGALLGGAFGGVLNAPGLVKGIRGSPKQVTPKQSDEEFALNIFKGKTEDATQQVNPNPEIVAAADRLGLDDVPASVLSDNIQFRELNQGLRSIPGSALKAKDVEFVEQVSQKADDLIEEFGGSLDKADFSSKFEQSVLNNIDDLARTSDDIYKAIDDVIPAAERVQPIEILGFLKERIRKIGGQEFITSAEKDLFKAMSRSPTYTRLDEYRKRIGDAKRGIGESIFRNADKTLLEQLESRLLADQQVVAKKFGQLDDFNKARSLVAQRKQLEQNFEKLLGREGSSSRRSITQVLDTAIRKLDKGNEAQLVKTLERIPKQFRESAMVTALNNIFSKNNKPINIANLDNFFNGLRKSPKAYNTVKNALPSGAMQRLDDIAKIVGGINRSNNANQETGRILTNPAVLEKLDDKMSKIFNISKEAGVLETGTSTLGLPGAGLTAAILRGSVNQGSKTQAADALLASPTFQLALKQEITKGMGSAKPLYDKIEKTSVYKRWLNSLTNVQREKIRRFGFYAYMSATSETNNL